MSGRAFRSRSPQKVHRTNWVLNFENGVSLEESHRTNHRTKSGWAFRSRSHQKIIFSTYTFLKESVQTCPVVVWGVRWSWSRKIGLSGGCSVGLLERNTHFLNSDTFLGWIFLGFLERNALPGKLGTTGIGHGKGGCKYDPGAKFYSFF